MIVTKKYCDICRCEIQESVSEFSFNFTSKAIFNTVIKDKSAVLTDICFRCTEDIHNKFKNIKGIIK